MKTIGEILKQARITRKYSLSQLAHVTKIREDYLEAIENNQFHKLPSATFVKGFVNNFAVAVELKPDVALAIFRRDFDQNQQGKVIPRGLTQPIVEPSKFWHPRTTSLLIASFFMLAIGVYAIRQILVFSSAPPITIDNPVEGGVTSNIVEVSGSTSSDAMVTVNNQPVAIDISGRFKTNLNLEPGTHTVVVQTQSRDGKTRTATRTITVETQR